MTEPQTPTIVSVTGGDSRRVPAIGSLLEDGRGSRDMRRLLTGIVALVVLFVGWSMTAEVDELTKARGEVQPNAHVQTVQTREGGTLAEVLVRKDQLVKAGQVLARFTTTNIDKEKTQVQVRLAALKIDLERWGAIAETRAPDFDPYHEHPHLVREARAQHTEQLALNDGRLRAKRSALEQQKAALAGVTSELPSAREELAATRDTLERDTRGVKMGVIPAMRLAEARQRAASAERSLKELQSRRSELEKSIHAAQSEVDQVLDQIAVEARNKRAEILEKVAELEAELNALNTRQGRRDITAPVAGFVKDLPDTVSGAIIPAGGKVAEIVPSEGGVFVEAKVSPRDIGFVEVGQTTLVKVDAYDYSRFGSATGKVRAISPAAFTDQQTGATYYKVEVELAKSYIGKDENRRLIPGMTGEVDIATGRKTVFQYLVKPVFIGADTAFHER